MYRPILNVVSLLTGLLLLNSCSLYHSIFEKEPESPITKIEHNLFWNANLVGKSELVINREKASAPETIKEKISYLDQKFTFIFELNKSLKSISVLHHNQFRDGYMQGNSYKIYLSADAVGRVPLDKDGNVIKNESSITDSSKVAYTRILFRDISQRLYNYYGYFIFDKKKKTKRFEKIQSQGYYLLTHEKL